MITYGEITRRLNVRVSKDNQKPDLDIKGLRAEIFEFFNFTSDTDIIRLTYIDGDGDTLSLVNNDDVLDVIWPEKCRKIHVHLRTEKKTQFHDIDKSASSNPISKVLKEPSQELSQFLLEVASKAAVASSALVELAQCFIQLANMHLDSDLQSSVPELSMKKAKSFFI